MSKPAAPISSSLIPAALCLAIGLLAGATCARDATVGACTQKDAFAKRLEKIDEVVQKLTGAKGDRERAKLAASIAKKFGGSGDIECLMRYREPEMRLVFLKLIDHKHWPVRARALYALKMVGDASVLPAIAEALDDKEPMVREVAASALSHLGDESSKEALTKRLDGEKDEYVRSAIESALAILERDEKPYTDYGKGKPFEETLVGPEGARRVEWAWVVKGQSSFNDYDAKAYDIPVASEFRYPTSWYKHDLFSGYPRNSFAAGGTHAATDCAWFREGCSYFAIADGVVRMVQGAGGDWGFLVVVEHLLESGDYITTVYGHSGFDVLVRPGEKVKCGQQLATQGLSCAIENGGYGSHLHFGIGDGPFRRPKSQRKGDSLGVTVDGVERQGKIVRFVYSAEEKNSYGWPDVAAIVALPDGSEHEVVLQPGEPQDEVSWLQAYIKDCVGWLDPEEFLPEHVEPKKKKKRR